MQEPREPRRRNANIWWWTIGILVIIGLIWWWWAAAADDEVSMRENEEVEMDGMENSYLQEEPATTPDVLVIPDFPQG